MRESSSPRLIGYLAMLAMLWGLFVISSIDLLDATKFCAVLSLQVLTGAEVYKFFNRGGNISAVETMAFGFSIGSLVWLLSDQVFIWLSLPHIGWLVPTSVALVIGYWRRHLRQIGNSGRDTQVEAEIWIVAASLVGLSGESTWTISVAIVLIIVLIGHKKIGPESASVKFNFLSALLLLVTTFVTVFSRPKIWWITHPDTHFYEAISTSVANWGFKDNIFASGYSLKYHWFPYAWSGMVSRISATPDWLVITRVGPIVATLCIIAFVWIITERFVPSHMSVATAGILVFAASPVFGDWSLSAGLGMFGSYSQHFSTIWLLPLLVWMVDTNRSALRAPWLLVSLFFIGLVGGKVAHAAIGLVSVVGFELVRMLKDHKSWRSSIFESMVAVFVVAATTFVLFGVEGSLVWHPAAWAHYLQGDLKTLSSNELLLVAVIFLSSFLHVAVLVSINGILSLRESSSIFVGTLLAVVAGVFLSNFSNSAIYPNGLYFVHSAAILAQALVGAVLFGSHELAENKKLSRQVLLVPLLAGVLAIVGTYLVPNLNSGAESAIFLRVSRSLNYLLVFPIVVFFVIVYSIRRSKRSFSPRRAILFSVVFLGVGTFFLKTISELPQKYSEAKRDGHLLVESQDLSSLGQWFSQNTFDETVYASNHVCFSIDCADPNDSRVAILVALIKRRALVQGPAIVSSFASKGKHDSDTDLDQRIQVSIDFALSPSEVHLRQFHDWGVRWYVVDLEITPTNHWTNSSATVYANGSYLVVDLNKVTLT